MATNINTNFLSFAPLVSRTAPDAKVLPIIGLVDFVKDAAYNIDLTATVSSAQLANPIQSVYIDASKVPYGLTTFTVNGSGQSIVVPPGVQGYYPLLCVANSFSFSLTNSGNKANPPGTAFLNLLFATVPYVAAEWNSFAITNGGVNPVLQGPVRTVTAGSSQTVDNMTTNDYTVLDNAATATIVEYLPTPGANQTMICRVCKIDQSSNQVIIQGNGANIETLTQYTLIQPGASVTFQWTGSFWKIIEQNYGDITNWNNYIIGPLPENVQPLTFYTNNQTCSIDLARYGGTPTSQYRIAVDVAANTGGLLAGNTFGIFNTQSGRLPLAFDASDNINFLIPNNINFGSNWTSFTPGGFTLPPGMTITGASYGTNQYLRIGPLVHICYHFTLTFGGTIGNNIGVPIPTPFSGGTTLLTGWTSANNWTACLCEILSGGIAVFMPGLNTFPASTMEFYISGTYRCA